MSVSLFVLVWIKLKLQNITNEMTSSAQFYLKAKSGLHSGGNFGETCTLFITYQVEHRTKHKHQ